MKKNLSLLMALVMVMALLCSCGAKITGIEVSAPEVMDRGETAELEVNCLYDREAPDAEKAAELFEGLGLTYSSSDESVVTVDENGALTAVGKGTAEITATAADGEIAASTSIQTTIDPKSISILDSLTLTLTKAEYTFKPVIEPEDADEHEITWSVSDESVATIDQDGKLTGVAEGTVTVTAAMEDMGLSATSEVTIAPKLTSITLSNVEIDMKPGDTATIQVISEPVNISQEAVVWKSTDPDVATVDEHGNVTAVDNGRTSINMFCKGIAVSCYVIVDETGEYYLGGVAKGYNSDGKFTLTQPYEGLYIYTDEEYGLIPYEDILKPYEHGLEPEEAAEFNPADLNSLKYGAGTWYGTNDDKDPAYAMAEAVNAMRAEKGLKPLTLDESMSKIALERAKYCSDNGLDGHRGAKTRGEVLNQTLSYSASSVMSNWRQSPGHYWVITNPYSTKMGTAVIYYRNGTEATTKTTGVIVFN